MANWTRERMVTELVSAMIASKLSFCELARLTEISSHALRELVHHGRIEALRWPEDVRALCHSLNISADDLLGLQERP